MVGMVRSLEAGLPRPIQGHKSQARIAEGHSTSPEALHRVHGLFAQSDWVVVWMDIHDALQYVWARHRDEDGIGGSSMKAPGYEERG